MADTFYVRDDIRQARQELQQTIAQLREESEQAARARDGAIRWLNTLFKNRPCQSILDEEVKDVVIRAIALLEGAGEATDGEAE